MPVKLNVGLSKKVGLPDYGSLGASCNVELELDSVLLHQDLQAFHEHVRTAYVACHQAILDELSRQQASPVPNNGHSAPQRADPPPKEATAAPRTNGQRSSLPSSKQLGYLRQLASEINGLGPAKLERLSERLYGTRVAALSRFDASALIDTLKAIKDGDIELERALAGGAR